MKKLTTEEFIEKARKIHGDKYDYSNSIYLGNHKNIEINCPDHGIFYQTPANHYRYGCRECANLALREKFSLSKADFINKAQKVHGDLYNYDYVNYVNYKTPVDIFCNVHGIFKQLPGDHIKNRSGCPKCRSFLKSQLEVTIEDNLKLNNISFEIQKTWDWLKFKNSQRVDFYLPDYNVAIECQGLQHFAQVGLFNRDYSLDYIQKRDKNKLDLCTKHGIKVLYYSNLGEDYNYPYNVITSPEVLIEEIKKIGPTNQSI